MADTTINDSMLKAMKAVTTDKSKSTKLKSDINLQTMDWMSLLVAQLKNQDMYNQTDNTQMMTQMAQYSQIQAVQSMVSLQEEIFAMNTSSYASSLIGKDVTVATLEKSTDSTGTTDKLVTTKGKITGVTLFEGSPMIYIGDKKFSFNQIMLIGDVPDGSSSSTGTGTDTTKTGGTTGGTTNNTTGGSGDNTTNNNTGGNSTNSQTSGSGGSGN
ncbi:flagellar hook capping FlgD N-terminal domain-containing protein [Aminipila terrae]|uniref:Basal-body rod modification protein FlgD n=1 Tax=Aminipila terrae TaxID=2697030 RepID=A0A6P1MD80_9FIRM|nr:flagellar hook capping FlgD N-terminal domain-containing protein [Aminipila terrae]QHI71972.1 hypothetical protein Ami3637_05810 [Aminipila terrae]